jgi:nanoRNase/pAp phosphatase (c-di-AMP/oligoRNAs hydrolase)
MSRAEQLVEQFEEGDSVAIVCHDNPDPDCLASAVALAHIAESRDVGSVEILYSGEISHQQNQAFVNLLDIDLLSISETPLDSFDCIAFVDHSTPGRHNEVPADVTVDIVVDHHPHDRAVEAAFVDLREQYGATASILVEYLRELDLEPTPKLASALLFAIHRERLDFVRNPTVNDYEAARYLFPSTDIDLLEQVYGAAFSPATLDAIGAAIRTREVRGSSLVSSIGATTEPGALPQAADYLLNLEGVDTVLVFGIVDGSVEMSARSIDPRVHLGHVLRDAFADVGQAGGHADMAGAQLPLGIFADSGGDREALVKFLSRRIRSRFFETLKLESSEDS